MTVARIDRPDFARGVCAAVPKNSDQHTSLAQQAAPISRSTRRRRNAVRLGPLPPYDPLSSIGDGANASMEGPAGTMDATNEARFAWANHAQSGRSFPRLGALRAGARRGGVRWLAPQAVSARRVVRVQGALSSDEKIGSEECPTGIVGRADPPFPCQLVDGVAPLRGKALPDARAAVHVEPSGGPGRGSPLVGTTVGLMSHLLRSRECSLGVEAWSSPRWITLGRARFYGAEGRAGGGRSRKRMGRECRGGTVWLVSASCACTPGSFTHEPHIPMSNFHLIYAVSRKTPPSPKTMKAVLDVQAELNRRLHWSHERLSLAPARQSVRAPFGFPFVRFAPSRPAFALMAERQAEAPRASCIEDAFACGSTKVRDDIWNAHLVVAFLKFVSTAHPELLLELRDDGGFVLPGAVRIIGGKVELDREWMNRARERALEMTGDPQAAAPFIWAEAEALEGRFFLEASASDFAEVPEIEELDLEWEQLQTVSLEDAAENVVRRAMASTVPVAA